MHRIGRTGRAGVSGVAVSLVSPEEHNLLLAIENLLRSKIPVEAVKGFTEDSDLPDFVLYRPGNMKSERNAPRAIKELVAKKLRPSCPFRAEARKRTPNRSPRPGARRKSSRIPEKEKIPGLIPNRAEDRTRSPALGQGKLDRVPKDAADETKELRRGLKRAPVRIQRDAAEGAMGRKIPARELANAEETHAARQHGPIPGPPSLPEGGPEAEASQACPQNGNLLRHGGKSRTSRLQDTLRLWIFLVPRISPFWDSPCIRNFQRPVFYASLNIQTHVS